MATAKQADTEQKLSIVVTAPNFKTVSFLITGTSPFVQNKFSKKAQESIRETQEAGSTAKSKKKREAKNFQELYEAARHQTTEGWLGIPAPAFRNAMIRACTMVGYHMTKAKMSVFVQADGYDKEDGTPLVKITKGDPQYHESYVRIAGSKMDLRARAMWQPGWQARVVITFDADQFTVDDVGNLLTRAGMQVGIGEGRPASPNSDGMGWGTFKLEGSDNQ